MPYPRALERYPRVRQSTLSTFDSCGLSAKFEAEYRQGWSTHPQARGQVFHRVAAECLRVMHRQKEQSIPVDAALAILHNELRQDNVDRVCPACESRSILRGVKGGKRTCGDCGHRFPSDLINLPMAHVKDLYWIVVKWANENTWDIENVVDIEHRLDANVTYENPAGGVVERVITGALDLVLLEGPRDDHAIVVDWKDTWGLPGPTSVSFEGFFQQRMYGMLVMLNYRSIERVTLREFYVRFSEPREVTIWRDQLDALVQEFGALVERFDRAVEEDAFAPTPGKQCAWCMRPSACPILPEVRAEGRIRTDAEAERMTRQMIVADATLAQARAALQLHASVHGPIPIRDAKGKRQLGYVESERTERPTREALEQAIAMYGIENVPWSKLYRKHKSTRFVQHRAPRQQVSDEDAVLMAAMEGSLAEAQARQRGE